MTAETMIHTECSTEEIPNKKKKLVVHGPGANSRNMINALRNLDASGHDVHYVGVSTATPAFEIEQGRIHYADTDEGKREIDELIETEEFRAEYYSNPVELHQEGLVMSLGHVAQGYIDFVVTTKPMVENPEQLRSVRVAKKAAEARLRERFGNAFDPEQNPVVLVHEHYLGRGAWRALRAQLGEISNRLGRLRSATVDIQEARTAEDEGRVSVVAGGAFEDLGPHAISLGLDAQEAINKNPNGRYTIADKSQMDVSFVRYKGSEFPDNIETGFSITGVTQVLDKSVIDEATGKPMSHELIYTWCGGKGLIDKKEVVLEFEHPDTGERTTITADLRTNENRLYVPDSVADLFPETKFEDNGYGASVEAGLNGGNPADEFQSFEAAAKAVNWGSVLTRMGRAKGEPITYVRGQSIQEIFHTP